jgi:hypothetical protein
MTNLAPTAKIAWRRPVITDMPKSRPTAEQADARHGEIDKYWQQQRKRRAESKPSEPKKVRLAAIRLRELQTIFRDRYGAQLPDDDAGLDDLELLVGCASTAGKKPEHQVSAWAPWCDAAEAERLIWSAATYPVWHTPAELAKRVGLRYSARKRLGIHTIRCIDANSKELEQLRCGNRNKNKRRKRAAAKAKKQKPETNMQTEFTAELSRRQQAVFEMVDGEIAAPRILEQLARHKAFRGIAAVSLRPEVHRVLNQLIELGLLKEDYQPGPKGMPVRYVSRHQQ